MPPRGRGRRKSGQMRADAALDAMRAFGFRERMISETLKELLQVYGEDGWVFIEDSSYKVLLEAILEKLKKEEEVKKEADKGEMDRDSLQHNGEVDQDVCSKRVTETGTQTEQSDAASVTDERVFYSPAHCSGGGGGGMKENDEGRTRIRGAKPCYGWISSEEEDEEDYAVRLTPQPLSENLKKLLLASNEPRKRKRKTRWDMRPEDLPTERKLQFMQKSR